MIYKFFCILALNFAFYTFGFALDSINSDIKQGAAEVSSEAGKQGAAEVSSEAGKQNTAEISNKATIESNFKNTANNSQQNTTTTRFYSYSMLEKPKYEKGFTNFQYVNTNAPKVGHFRLGALGGFDSFYDFLLKGASADGLELVFEPLFVRNAEESSAQYGLLAEFMELDSKNRFVIFWLNENARFSDGSAVCAEDVEFSFELLAKGENPKTARYYADVGEVELLNNFSIQKQIEQKAAGAVPHEEEALRRLSVRSESEALKSCSGVATGAAMAFAQCGTNQSGANRFNENSQKTCQNNRIKFNFKNPQNRELAAILADLKILKKEQFMPQNSRDFKAALKKIAKNPLNPPIGSGPYVISNFEPNRFINYQKNPHYWALSHPTRVGLYNFSKISYEYYKDDSVALEAFKAARLDFRREMSAKNWAKGYEGTAKNNKQIALNSQKHALPAGMQGFVFNTRRELFKDPAIRAALSLGFDFEWANKNIFYDQYKRTTSFFQNSPFAANAAPNEQEREILKELKEKFCQKDSIKIDSKQGAAEVSSEAGKQGAAEVSSEAGKQGAAEVSSEAGKQGAAEVSSEAGKQGVAEVSAPQNGWTSQTNLPKLAQIDIESKQKTQIPSGDFCADFTKIFTQNPPTPPQNLAQQDLRENLKAAQKILRERGFYFENHKLKTTNGANFSFEILLVSPAMEKVALAYARNLKKLGITARTRLVDLSQYINRAREFDFDMIVAVIPQSLSPGNEQSYFWSSAAANENGSYNYAGIKNPQIDFLIQKIIAAKDFNELKILCSTLDRLLRWGYYFLPQYHSDSHRLALWSFIKTPNNPPLYDLGIESWWFSDEDFQKLLKERPNLAR